MVLTSSKDGPHNWRSTPGRRSSALKLTGLALCLLLNYTTVRLCIALPIVHHHSALLLAQERNRRQAADPTVNIERVSRNSIRIDAVIDIPNTNIEEVWDLLTDYENLQDVIPNLVANEVIARLSGNRYRQICPSPMRGGGFTSTGFTSLFTSADEIMTSNAERCKVIANQMKGSVLKQVGGAKVMGMNFRARTTLEVREWPKGLPDFAHDDERNNRCKKKKKLARYVFPRPFNTLSSMPRKDISMLNIEKDDGEFKMYQGVWRMQPLPGCRPATRLTYAVEVSPRVPVGLVEERIGQDLSINLEAIRDACAKKKHRMIC